MAYVVDVPERGPRRLCGAHARTVRIRDELPAPRAPKPHRVSKSPREPAKAVAPLFPRRTVSAINQRRATLRQAGRP